MTTNNKILTVSYGTFSCTLEGFDDNFGTMKAIAEYFRDLASDDRYFGAEPPQPDVEMLARIAEREISRRVEARQHDGRFVLSAEDAEADVQDAARHIDPEDMARTVENDAPAAEQVSAPAEELPEQPESLLNTPDDATSAAEADIQTGAANLEMPEETLEEKAPADLSEPAETVSNAAQMEDTDAAAEETEYSATQAEAFFAQPSAPEEPETRDVASLPDAVDTTEPPAPDSIAAKLQRIRDVVTQSQQDEGNSLFEDEYAEDFATDASNIDHQVTADTDNITEANNDADTAAAEGVEAVQSPQEAEDAAVQEFEDDRESVDIAKLLSEVYADTERTSLPSEGQDDANSIPEEIESDVLLLDEPFEFGSDADRDESADLGARLEPDQVDALETENANIRDESDAPEATGPRARILKVKRTDIEAAIASGALEEVEDVSNGAAKEAIPNLEVDRAASPDGMDALQEDPEFPDHDDTDATAVQHALEDDDVSRLMAEADTHMEEPEGTSRRSAFAHLKAAVKAKKADLGIGSEDQDSDDAYRSDLASVVKPRRPETSGSASRSESKRPAPLKLVAEQRVDVAAAPTGPVRPRRVATREEPAAPDTGTSFEEYAAAMGAHDLPELLEAAASYLSFIEGREQFSRPQLMTKVRQIEKDEFSREDGLRSFGQLLRAGKIEKIKGGRFAVTGDIGYQPDQRAAG